ncbi:lamin tail domain-containing protein [Flavobacterium sp.]|uniref:lamin tail domain-containing protein n=1 Tax=Flavobacterium sp. TaxID=239 RepID=UPI00391A5E47
MKNTLHFRKIQHFFFLSFTMLLLLLSGKGYGQTLYEDFNYTSPLNIGGSTSSTGGPVNNWFTHSNSQVGVIAVTSGSLSYTGLQASTGDKVRLPASNSTVPRDVNRATSGTGATIAYYSVLINVADATQLSATTPDYFMCFGATSGTSVTSLGARLGIKSVNSGAQYRLSISNTTTTFTEFAQDLVFGTTYLIVVKYDRGTNPTVASLWVNPSSLGGAEPSGAISNTSGTSTFAAFASICLRNSSSTPKADIDEIRVGTTWASVTPIPLLAAPTVTTTAAVVDSATSATLAGNVTAVNGADVSGNGSVYSTTDATPTIAEGATQLATDTPGIGAGAFSKSTGSVLSVNTLYYYNAYAINSQGTGYGTASSFYTLANLPTTPSVDTPTTTSLNVTLGGSDGNPSTTQYAIQANGGNYVQADGSLAAGVVWQTAATWGIKTVTGLSSSTLYSFAVKARNGANVETAFGTAGTRTTDTVTAANLVLTTGTPAFGDVCVNTEAKASFTFNGFNLNSTDLTVSSSRADTVITYSLTENGTYAASLTIPNSGTSLSNQVVWVKFAPIEELTLAGDVFSISGGGLALPFEFSVTGTAVNTVVSGVTTAAATNITAVAATFNAGTFVIGCSPVTYGIEYSTSAIFTGSQTITDALPYTLSDLEPNTTYYYRAFAIDDVDAAFGAALSFTTSQLAAPNDLPGDPVSYDSFTANWEPVTGADEYRLDVSSYPSFGITTPTTDLFFSEYFEGSANNKYIEIYNGTGASVDLSDYQLILYSNGGVTATNNPPLALSGILANGATIVYKNASAAVYGGAATSSAAINFNGDDAIALFKISTASYVDIFGRIGEDPGSAWTATGISTSDKTLVRKPTVLGGVTVNPVSGFPTLAAEWTQLNIDTVSNLGSHSIDNVTPSFIIENQSVAGTSYPVTGLEGSTNYYYRVRAKSTNSTSANSDVVTVTTDATPPTFGSVSQSGAEEVCDGSEGTFNVTGLLPNSTSTITYNINGGAPQTFTDAVANISGFATFAVTLPASFNGLTLTVTQIERTDVVSPVLTVTTNNTAVIAVQSRYSFFVDADNDGFGSTTTSMECSSSAAVAPTGFATNDEDCDDLDQDINPDATEVNFNGEDDDCDGSIFNGHDEVVSNVTPPSGALAAMTTPITCSVATNTAPYSGASVVHKFRVTRTSPPAAPVEFESATRTFAISSLAIAAYAATYEVQATAIVNGEEQPYNGNTAIYTTPAAPVISTVSEISTNQCNQTLTAINSYIYASNGPAVVQLYDFEVIREVEGLPTHTQVYTTTVPYFRLTSLSMPATYGTVYKVRSRYGYNSFGSEIRSSYSTQCTITTPSMPTVQVVGTQCGQTLASINAYVYSTSGLGSANLYEFKVTRIVAPGETAPAVIEETIPRIVPYFRLTMLENLFIGLGKEYSVSVRYRVNTPGVTPSIQYSDWSPVVCSVFTPEFPTTGIVDAQCNLIDFTPSMTQYIYSGIITGATQYRFRLELFDELSSTPEVPVYSESVDSANNYVTLNQFTGLLPSTTYVVTVAVELYGEFGPFGKDCAVTTPDFGARTATALVSSSFEATAYPNPFANNFTLGVKTSSESSIGVKLFDMVGRLVDQNTLNVAELKNATIGDQYPSGVYNVVITQDGVVKTLRVVKR